ncbi:GntR family transcriptional regulator [Companilactobacillus nuruki]|uniref:GntR family transcriptional regulator n=1 Tax=Companilactobacillus nuruki TaxID=1993540 RepID=A0A2N7AXU0_9LACO|nr:GntR family transcriptional regulator [Companilactobacillus nuruki]PMD73892.1 GntR family transcriptional regulator [Companilactobacillus nuruki]
MSKYEDVANDIIEKIKSGVYPTGEPLPDQKRLAKEYSTSRMTLQKSLSILKSKGFVYSQQGAATYVKSNADSIANMDVGVDQYVGTTKLLGDSRQIVSKIIKFKMRYPNKDEQEKLKIDPTDVIYDIKRLRIVDGKPYALEYTTMPVKLIPGVDEKVLHNSIYGYIQNELKLIIGAAFRNFTANKPTSEDMEYLEIKEDDPVFRVTQTVFLDDGTPYEYSTTDRPYDTGGYVVFVSHNSN